MGYVMYETPRFAKWLTNLKHLRARAAIISRLDRIAFDGHFGEHEPVFSCVKALSVPVGEGYRIYYCMRDAMIVILLANDRKGSRKRDIAKLKKMIKKRKKNRK